MTKVKISIIIAICISLFLGIFYFVYLREDPAEYPLEIYEIDPKTIIIQNSESSFIFTDHKSLYEIFTCIKNFPKPQMYPQKIIRRSNLFWTYRLIFTEAEKTDIIVDSGIYYIPHTARTLYVTVNDRYNVIQFGDNTYETTEYIFTAIEDIINGTFDLNVYWDNT